jgi:hypothetical protein
MAVKDVYLHRNIREISRNVLYSDRGGSYMVAYICQSSLNCTFKMDASYSCKLYHKKVIFKKQKMKFK